jgi:hypothetical protein
VSLVSLQEPTHTASSPGQTPNTKDEGQEWKRGGGRGEAAVAAEEKEKVLGGGGCRNGKDREVLGTKPGRDNGYPELYFSWFS